MKRRQVVLLCGIWTALFVCISGAIAAAKVFAPRQLVTQSERDQIEARTQWGEFIKLPTVSDGPELDDLQRHAPDFVTRLSDEVFAHQAALRACKAGVMNNSSHRTEYFEVSFVVAKSSVGSRFDDVQLERATLPLSAEDKTCILDAFSEMPVTLPDAPDGRIKFTFCFNNREQ